MDPRSNLSLSPNPLGQVKLYHRDDNETEYIPLSEVEEAVFKGVDSCDVGIVWNQVPATATNPRDLRLKSVVA